MASLSGWKALSTKYHRELEVAVAKYKGKQLKTREVDGIVRAVPNLRKDAQFIYASDHCLNHTNEGACECAMTERALFKKIRRGEYQVL